MTNYEYACVLDDGRLVGVGPTEDLGSVESDHFAWSMDGFGCSIKRRQIMLWEDVPE